MSASLSRGVLCQLEGTGSVARGREETGNAWQCQWHTREETFGRGTDTVGRPCQNCASGNRTCAGRHWERGNAARHWQSKWHTREAEPLGSAFPGGAWERENYKRPRLRVGFPGPLADAF